MAAVLLCHARLLVAAVPLRFWRHWLGLAGVGPQNIDRSRHAWRLARHVERAAARLPFATKCLPRAMALSMLLRRAGISHDVVFAVRPRRHGESDSRLHAWVRHRDAILIGDEPGPWIEILALGAA